MTTTRPNAAIYKSILFVAAGLAIVSSMSSSVPIIFAQTSSNTGVSSSSSSDMEKMILNLGIPLYIEHARDTNITNINQNITRVTFEGNGTFMLPNGNVSTIDSGYSIINSTGGLVRSGGQAFLKTIDGKAQLWTSHDSLQLIRLWVLV